MSREGRPDARTRGDEVGFALVELVVTMAIAIVVLLAILQTVDVVSAESRKANDRAQAQETARTTVRHLVGTLREARLPPGQTTPLPPASTPSRQDLVVAANVSGASNPSPGAVEGWIRYCVTADGKSLLVGVRAVAAYAAPGTCALSTTTNAWSYGVVVDGTLRDATRLFDYSSGSCVAGRAVASATASACTPTAPTITSVGLRVSVAKSLDDTTGSAIVRDAVTLRNGSTT